MKLSLRLLFFALSCSVATSVYATINTFTGTGSWADNSKWSLGHAPVFTFATDTIVIDGDCTFYNSGSFVNDGSINILPNRTLNLPADNSPTAEFRQEGWLDVQGNLTVALFFTNRHTINISSGGSITNSALFRNSSPLFTIHSGGAFTNTSTGRFESGAFTIQNGASFINNGKIGGYFSITGNFSNGGTVAPGNSPGTATISGNYTATGTAVHNFEVAGTAAGSYDVLNVSGTATLNGTLNITFINGYTKTTDQDIAIITGTISGTFSTINVPSSYVVVYTANSVLLRPASVLPVSFVSLDAKKDARGTLLTWHIENEQNLLRYDVEKSNDGISFTAIGTVTAVSRNQYTFTDATSEAKNFYRIKSIDNDGRHQYSSVIQFNQGKSTITFKAVPTLVQKTVLLQHNTATTNSMITVVSTDGRVMKRIIPKAGLQQTTIDFSAQKPGVYIIRYEDDKTGQVEAVKIIRQ